MSFAVAEQRVDLVLVGDVDVRRSVGHSAPPSSADELVRRAGRRCRRSTTCAPSSTNRRTVARPMPEHPPVTTATLPSRRPAMVLSSLSQPVVADDEDVLLLGERVRGVRAELAAEPGLLVAAERRPVAHRRVRVHAEVAGLDAARDPQRPADVAGEDRAGQAVLGVVGQRDRLLLVVERHHRDDRPEDLLAPDRARRCRRRARRSAAARSRRRPGADPVNATVDAVEVAGTVSRCCAEISGPISLSWSRRVDHPHARVTAVSSRPRNSSYADRSTRIRDRAQQSWPALSKTAYGAVAAAWADVGVGEDDVGALAAELEGHPLHLVGAAGHDPLARPRWSR